MEREYLNYALDKLEKIVNIPSPSGFTRQAAEFLMGELEALGYEPKMSNKGNVLAELGGEGDALILSCHIDTLGGIVSRVKDNGRLEISPIGCFYPNSIETETVKIHTRSGKIYTGTFLMNSPAWHVNADLNTDTRTFANTEVVIDEKTKTAEETRALGIENGDIISFDPRFVVTESGFIKSRHLDDKLSSCVLLAYAKYLKDTGTVPKRKLYLQFTVYEEIGHGASSFDPGDATEILAIDMGCAGPGIQCDETMVSICAKNSEGPSNYEMVSKLVEVAKASNLNYGIDVYPFYASDADNLMKAGGDMRHAVIGAGVSASHSYERSHIEGVMNTYELMKNYINL